MSPTPDARRRPDAARIALSVLLALGILLRGAVGSASAPAGAPLRLALEPCLASEATRIARSVRLELHREVELVPVDTEAMARVLRDEGLRRDLRARGFARARQFSWERSVRRIHQIYQEVLAS